MLKKHPNSVKLVRVTVSRLHPTATPTSRHYGIKVGGDGHAPSPVAHPPAVAGIAVSPSISIGVQDGAQNDVNRGRVSGPGSQQLL